MEIDKVVRHPRYTIGQIAEAASMSVGLLKNWTDRGVFDADAEGNGPGRPAKFSFLSALHVALTARLVEMGLSPLHARDVASIWPATSFGPASAAPTGRTFGGLYGAPYWTIFAVSPDGGATIEAVDPGKTLAAEMLLWLGGTGGWKRMSFVVLDPIRARAEQVLKPEVTAGK